MNNINQRILSKLPEEKRLVYAAMMIDPKLIPDFNGQLIKDAYELGEKIKKLFDDKVFTKMFLTQNSEIILS